MSINILKIHILISKKKDLLKDNIWLRCRTSNETYHPENWTLKHSVEIDNDRILNFSFIGGERDVASYLSNGKIIDPLELGVEPYACYYVTRCISKLESGGEIIIDVLEQEKSYYVVCTIDPLLKDEISQLGINFDLEASSKIKEFLEPNDKKLGWFEEDPFKDNVSRDEIASFYESLKIVNENYERYFEKNVGNKLKQTKSNLVYMENGKIVYL